MIIYHIASMFDWKRAIEHNEFVANSLLSHGFIHCSTREQVIPVANDRFSGQNNLMLMAVDTDKLSAQVVCEDLRGTGQFYPHVYGSIPMSAVVNVCDFTPRMDGLFEFPENL